MNQSLQRLQTIIHRTPTNEITIEDQKFLLTELHAYLLPLRPLIEQIQDEMEKDLGVTVDVNFNFGAQIGKILKECSYPILNSEI
ncbi:hypothetical protein [Algoriphagus vanfongensis]|uniref:hypothetical protein n=1 Tax=Algoriphagus vanfongensis TaxID=426371 RepID=UPI00047C7104|nr:hypothetical protein [Algoriphagus vanfongensis]